VEDEMADDSPLPVLGYALEDIPRMTNGVISRTRVFEDLGAGRLHAKRVGKRDLITPEEARRYINSFPDRPTRAGSEAPDAA
jgi:hypothetical protein